MAKVHVIAVLGSQGGSGKSTIARMLSLGAAACCFEVILVSGDAGRPGAAISSPPYQMIDTSMGDASSPVSFMRMVETVKALTDCSEARERIIIIDGDKFWDQRLNCLLADEVPPAMAVMAAVMPDRSINSWISSMVNLTVIPVAFGAGAMQQLEMDWRDTDGPRAILVNQVMPEPRLHAVISPSQQRIPSAIFSDDLLESLPVQPFARVFAQPQLSRLFSGHPDGAVRQASILLWLQLQAQLVSPTAVSSRRV